MVSGMGEEYGRREDSRAVYGMGGEVGVEWVNVGWLEG